MCMLSVFVSILCSLVMSFLYVRMREDDLESFPSRELTLPCYMEVPPRHSKRDDC